MAVPDAVADRLADTTLSAHLATSVDDRPHVAPVWYRYDDGHLQVLTGGRKLANVRENPRVAVSVEATGEDNWLVVLRGTATVIKDESRHRSVARDIFETYTGDPEAAEYEDGEPDGVLVDIRIGSATLRTD